MPNHHIASFGHTEGLRTYLHELQSIGRGSRVLYYWRCKVVPWVPEIFPFWKVKLGRCSDDWDSKNVRSNDNMARRFPRTTKSPETYRE